MEEGFEEGGGVQLGRRIFKDDAAKGFEGVNQVVIGVGVGVAGVANVPAHDGEDGSDLGIDDIR